MNSVGGSSCASVLSEIIISGVIYRQGSVGCKCAFFIGWIIVQKLDSRNRTSKSKVRCRICNKSFNVIRMGEAALVGHMKGKKHTYLMDRKPKENLAAPEVPSEVEMSSSDQ